MTTSPKPRKRLPENPSEENLRKQAKRLAKSEDLQLAAAQRKLRYRVRSQELVRVDEGGRGSLRAVPTATPTDRISTRGVIQYTSAARNRSQRSRRRRTVRVPFFWWRKETLPCRDPWPEGHVRGRHVGRTVDECVRLGDGTIKAIIVGAQRARVSEFVFDQDFYKAKCEALRESARHSSEFRALMLSVMAAFPAGRLLLLEGVEGNGIRIPRGLRILRFSRQDGWALKIPIADEAGVTGDDRSG